MMQYYASLRRLALTAGLSLGTLLAAQAQSTCPTPAILGVTTASSTSVSVAFSVALPPANTTYTVTCVPAGGSSSAGTTVTTATSSPVTVAGLAPSTTYQLYLQATCGTSGSGTQVGPLSFTTYCPPATTYPYTENFDGSPAPVMPCSYALLDANNDGLGWTSTASTTFASSGLNAMRYTYSALNPADDWFFTRGLQMQAGVTYQLQFKYRTFSSAFVEALEVKIGAAATVAGQTRTLFTNAGIATTSYVTTTAGSLPGQVLSFTPTTSGVYYLGFHAMSVANQWYLFVDDISVASDAVAATKSSVAPGFRAEASPVPFQEQLTLQLHTLQAGPLQLTLHDAVGRVVRQTSAPVPAGASSLNVPGAGTLPAGLYLLTVRQGGNTQVLRVTHE